METVVGIFALLGFAFVPLGSKTGLEHAIALAETPTAREAVTGLLGMAARARDQLLQVLAPRSSESAPLPLPSAGAGGGVRPLPPPLPPSAASARP